MTVQLVGVGQIAHLMTRSGAQAGDDIYVTGSLGDSAAVWRF